MTWIEYCNARSRLLMDYAKGLISGEELDDEIDRLEWDYEVLSRVEE